MKLTLLVMGLLVYAPIVSAQSLPEHSVVEESPLPNGTRVQINVEDVNLTRKQCSDLIEAYREKALPEGQISVHKPSNLKGLDGAILPYCVENFDGEGITFDTTFHPDSE